MKFETVLIIDFRQQCLNDVEQCSSGILKQKVWDEDDFYQEEEDEIEIRGFDNGKKVSRCGWPMLVLIVESFRLRPILVLSAYRHSYIAVDNDSGDRYSSKIVIGKNTCL